MSATTRFCDIVATTTASEDCDVREPTVFILAAGPAGHTTMRRRYKQEAKLSLG